eukprot:CAMPEP_0114976050 /NCGR_PEP_ID=MMETSP0216-20121206/2445_1 /TAXON_ID=223996 /ORGANISM="Protocruzia adherens, Strain Boccale" /LENGTH=828 /DNA_ID=CAMNT_0002336911 /DNA_START=39 /DNA_END=2525 /DNA_ORIENTATION=-
MSMGRARRQFCSDANDSFLQQDSVGHGHSISRTQHSAMGFNNSFSTSMTMSVSDMAHARAHRESVKYPYRTSISNLNTSMQVGKSPYASTPKLNGSKRSASTKKMTRKPKKSDTNSPLNYTAGNDKNASGTHLNHNNLLQTLHQLSGKSRTRSKSKSFSSSKLNQSKIKSQSQLNMSKLDRRRKKNKSANNSTVDLSSHLSVFENTHERIDRTSAANVPPQGRRTNSRTPASVNVSFNNSFNTSCTGNIHSPQKGSLNNTTGTEHRGITKGSSTKQSASSMKKEALRLEEKLADDLRRLEAKQDKYSIEEALGVYRKIFNDIIERDKTFGPLLHKIKNVYEDCLAGLYTTEGQYLFRDQAFEEPSCYEEYDIRGEPMSSSSRRYRTKNGGYKNKSLTDMDHHSFKRIPKGNQDSVYDGVSKNELLKEMQGLVDINRKLGMRLEEKNVMIRESRSRESKLLNLMHSMRHSKAMDKMIFDKGSDGGIDEANSNETTANTRGDSNGARKAQSQKLKFNNFLTGLDGPQSDRIPQVDSDRIPKSDSTRKSSVRSRPSSRHMEAQLGFDGEDPIDDVSKIEPKQEISVLDVDSSDYSDLGELDSSDDNPILLDDMFLGVEKNVFVPKIPLGSLQQAKKGTATNAAPVNNTTNTQTKPITTEVKKNPLSLNLGALNQTNEVKPTQNKSPFALNLPAASQAVHNKAPTGLNLQLMSSGRSGKASSRDGKSSRASSDFSQRSLSDRKADLNKVTKLDLSKLNCSKDTNATSSQAATSEKVGIPSLNLQPKQNTGESKYIDFNDEFMENYDDFSMSWRQMIDRERQEGLYRDLPDNF